MKLTQEQVEKRKVTQRHTGDSSVQGRFGWANILGFWHVIYGCKANLKTEILAQESLNLDHF